MIEQYIEIYLVACLIIYVVGLLVDYVVHLIKWHLVGYLWDRLKTTNLTLMYKIYMLHYHFKEIIYSVPNISMEWEDFRYRLDYKFSMINKYGLTRDKWYYGIGAIIKWIKQVFWMNKRNIISVGVTIVYINYKLLVKNFIDIINLVKSLKVLEIILAIEKIYSKVKKYFSIENIKNILVIVLLIGVIWVIIKLLFYSKTNYLKEFEKIWIDKKENEEKVKEAAELQQQIFQKLNELSKNLFDNLLLLLKLVRMTDNHIKANTYSATYDKYILSECENLKNCKEIMNDIKGIILEIEKTENIDIYRKYNKHCIKEMWSLDINHSKKEYYFSWTEILNARETIVSYIGNIDDIDDIEDIEDIDDIDGIYNIYNIDRLKSLRDELYNIARIHLEHYSIVIQYLIKNSRQRLRIRKQIHIERKFGRIKQQLEEAKGLVE